MELGAEVGGYNSMHESLDASGLKQPFFFLFPENNLHQTSI